MTPLVIEIPGLRTVNEKNQREHWAVKARRTKEIRNVTTIVASATIGMSKDPFWQTRDKTEPLVVTLTRIAPRRLDVGDNLNLSLSGARDSIAQLLGIDDGSDLITWLYTQERSKPKTYGVRITIAPREVDRCIGQSRTSAAGTSTPACGRSRGQRR